MLVEDNLLNMKSLTEEQKRMRELMGFTYKDNSHDILAEQNIKVIREEHGGRFNKEYAMKKDLDKRLNNITYAKDNCISPKETAQQLHLKLIDVLENKIVELKKQVPVEVYYQGLKLNKKVEVPYGYELESFDLSTSIPLSDTLEEIFNDPVMGKCFKTLYDSFPVISNQFNDDTVKFTLEDFKPRMEIGHKGSKKDRSLKKNCKDKLIKDQNDISLKSLERPFCTRVTTSQSNKHLIWVDNGGYIDLKKIQLAGAEVNFDGYFPDTWIPVDEKECECKDLTTGEMIKYPCDGPKPPECIEDITPIELKLDLVDAFAFDKVEDTDGTSLWHENGGKQFDDFIELYNKTKDKYSMVWDQYLEFLKDKGVIIYGYASRDDDPNENMRGEYAECNVDKIVGAQNKLDINTISVYPKKELIKLLKI